MIKKLRFPVSLLTSMKFRLVLSAAMVLVFCGLAAAWRMTPLGTMLQAEEVLVPALFSKSFLAGGVLAITLYVLGGLVSFPVVVLIPATALVFGTLPGVCVSLLGLLANASALYLIGSMLGQEAVRQLAGKRVHRVREKLSRHGFLTVITLRFLPVAPFSVINLMSGALHIKYTDYAAGTLIGLFPGVVIMSVVGDRMRHASLGSAEENVLLLIGAVVLLLAGYVWYRLRTRAGRPQQ